MRLPFQDPSGFFRHGSLLMVGTLFGSLFNAAFHVVTGRALPEVQYAALVAMLGIVLALGQPMLAVQNTVAHYVSRLVALGRAPEVFPFFSKAAPARLLLPLAPLFAVLAALGHPWLSRFWPVPPSLLCLVAALVPLTLWMSLFSGLWQGLQDFPRLAFIPQLWGVVRFALAALAVAVGLRTAIWPLAAQLLGVLLVMALGFAYLVSRRPAAPPPLRPCPGAPPLAYLLQAVLSLAAFGLLMNFDTSLALHHHPADAPLFAKAATIARTAVFLPVPLAAALFPKVSSDGELPPGSRRLLFRALAAAAVVLAFVLAACLILPSLPWFILYGPCPAPDLPAAREAYFRDLKTLFPRATDDITAHSGATKNRAYAAEQWLPRWNAAGNVAVWIAPAPTDDDSPVEILNTAVLGKAFEPQQRFEDYDGNDIIFDTDYFGAKRTSIIPGPFASLDIEGVNVVL